MLWFLGLQRVGHNWVTVLTDAHVCVLINLFSHFWIIRHILTFGIFKPSLHSGNFFINWNSISPDIFLFSFFFPDMLSFILFIMFGLCTITVRLVLSWDPDHICRTGFKKDEILGCLHREKSLYFPQQNLTLNFHPIPIFPLSINTLINETWGSAKYKISRARQLINAWAILIGTVVDLRVRV